jgi:hypothetical protein
MCGLLHSDIETLFQITDGHPDGFIGGHFIDLDPECSVGFKLSRRQLGPAAAEGIFWKKACSSSISSLQ